MKDITFTDAKGNTFALDEVVERKRRDEVQKQLQQVYKGEVKNKAALHFVTKGDGVVTFNPFLHLKTTESRYNALIFLHGLIDALRSNMRHTVSLREVMENNGLDYSLNNSNLCIALVKRLGKLGLITYQKQHGDGYIVQDNGIAVLKKTLHSPVVTSVVTPAAVPAPAIVPAPVFPPADATTAAKLAYLLTVVEYLKLGDVVTLSIKYDGTTK